MARRWEAIRDTIVSEIVSDRTSPGKRLPPTRELAARFGVNRLTVTQALNAMQRDGYVRVEHGVGVFVANDVIRYQLSEQVSFTRNLLSQNKLARREMISTWVGPASEDVLRHLRLEAGAEVTCVVARSYADASPIALATTYLPTSLVPHVRDAFVRENSIREALRRCGVAEYRRRWTQISARTMTKDEARELRVTPASVGLIQENVDVLPGGEPIKYGISVTRGDMVKLYIDFDEMYASEGSDHHTLS